jgi:phosphatidylserine/phosphatidylglycerophosphate/cardiolipin synthase-like enzyme
VQLLRTYPHRHFGYRFAPQGERSIARGYRKALGRARSLVYVEDQYLWSPEVAATYAEALRANPELRLIAVIPRFPDTDGRLSGPPELAGRLEALRMLRAAGGDRVTVYCLENHAGTPVYVHAKVCVVDDTWAVVGSDNVSMRSWTFDSELSCAVLDGDGRYARELRLQLAREHLDRPEFDATDAVETFEAFARSAATLETWYAGGRRGPRPPGRLRVYQSPELSPATTVWAGELYRFVFDPDGRPAALRRARRF